MTDFVQKTLWWDPILDMPGHVGYRVYVALALDGVDFASPYIEVGIDTTSIEVPSSFLGIIDIEAEVDYEMGVTAFDDSGTDSPTMMIFTTTFQEVDMALTELQLPAKANFYNKLSNSASEMDNLMNRWKNLSEFIGFVDTTDLDAMEVPPGAIRTDMADYRTILDLFVDCFYNGTAIAPTDIPADVIDKIRRM